MPTPNALNYPAIGNRQTHALVAQNSRFDAGGARAKGGLSVSFYGHIERGGRVPSLETMARLAAALGVRVDDLLFGSNQ